ncbi:hypothetical protein [Hydrogenophaga sp. NFH-34]|uniref:hypothetical protein n=1 Tax=Hydrogenophaga sp. NFH-34 TaxID=2744446 RepID=UPI001F47ED0E|nr:hypothetical protein [Hydrogenophaga sp. NFH-34]
MNTPATIQDPSQPVTQAQLAWTQHLIADSLRSLVSYVETRNDERFAHHAADLMEKLHEHAGRLESAALRPEPNPSMDW